MARQLFDALVFQLIHWFTQNAQYESAETMVLLDAILEGLAAGAPRLSGTIVLLCLVDGCQK